MDTYSWILCGLAAFDVLIVASFFVVLRTQPFLDRKGRLVTAIALSGFVFHAFLFFEGAILAMQLAMLAVIYLGLALVPPRRQPTDGADGRR
jgi:hypothetical protein